MTKVQRRVMLFIQSRIDETGKAPTYAEMRKHLGYASKSYLHTIVKTLSDDGYLGRVLHIKGSRTRGIRLLRRINPIIEFQVWDEQSQALVPLGQREAAA